MPLSFRLLLPLAALVGALVLASCGGGSTTTVERTVTVMKTRKAPAAVFLPDVTGRHLVKPRTYSLSVDGDLVMKNLSWKGWGGASATATGKAQERPASGLVDTFSGSIRASKPRVCAGARYYTEVTVRVPPQAPLVPTEPTRLETPCQGG